MKGVFASVVAAHAIKGCSRLRAKSLEQTMNTISIGNESRSLEQADPEWITQQIQRRRQDAASVCVRIQINSPDLNISFATPSCASSGRGGGRPPNAREREVLDLWAKHGLNDQQFSPGSVVAFVKQALRLI
jgi:hypothetical protein